MPTRGQTAHLDPDLSNVACRTAHSASTLRHSFASNALGTSAGILSRRGGYMRRFFLLCVLGVAAILPTLFLAGCGGSSKANSKVAKIVLFPTSISLNEGGVATLSAVTENSDGASVAADL